MRNSNKPLQNLNSLLLPTKDYEQAKLELKIKEYYLMIDAFIVTNIFFILVTFVSQEKSEVEYYYNKLVSRVACLAAL
jgi:hypothetical protein